MTRQGTKARPSGRTGLGWVAASGALVLGLVVFGLTFGSSAASGAQPHHLVVTLTPPGPYVNRQTVTVTVPPNPILKPGQSLTIEECSAQTAGRVRWELCDPRTAQPVTLTAGPDGSVSYPGYPIVSLPDAALGESPWHRPRCGLSHPCTLRIGGVAGDPRHWVWSNSFLVSGNPGTGTPEVPYALVLPVIAGAIFGGWVLLRRRRVRTRPE